MSAPARLVASAPGAEEARLRLRSGRGEGKKGICFYFFSAFQNSPDGLPLIRTRPLMERSTSASRSGQ